MKLSPQKSASPVNLETLAARCTAAGACLVDARWMAIGDVNAFFTEYALPRLRSGEGAGRGIICGSTTIQSSQSQSQSVHLLAFDGDVPEDLPTSVAKAAEELPIHNGRSFARLMSDLPSIVRTLHALTAADVDRDKLTGELADTYEELSLVYKLGSSMTVSTPPGPFLTSACASASAVMETRSTGVLVWDSTLGEHAPQIHGQHQFTAEVLHSLGKVIRRRLEEVEDNACILVNKSAKDADFHQYADHFTQLLAVPLRRHGRTLGCVFALDKDVEAEVFGTFNRGVFTSIDRKLLFGVAVHIALFLENRKLFTDSEDLMMGLLHSLTAAVDAKDTYTCGHSVRVALFAKRLAQEAGYDVAFCERVYLAGLLHDVGKIGVDDAVLRKPGRLTDDEFAMIKRHPEIGHRILTGIPQIDDILPGVLFHHEKYDGRGYPRRRAGEEIPVLGRIMCIADSFDAMTSSRTYRAAMPLGKAMAEIQACKGTQFDPDLADAFCRIPEEEIARLIAVERDRCNLTVTALQRVA